MPVLLVPTPPLIMFTVAHYRPGSYLRFARTPYPWRPRKKPLRLPLREIFCRTRYVSSRPQSTSAASLSTLHLSDVIDTLTLD